MSSKKNSGTVRPPSVEQKRSKGTSWVLIAIAVAAVAAGGIFIASGSSDRGQSLDTIEPTVQAPSPPVGSPAPDYALSAVNDTPLTADELSELPMPPLPYAAQMTGPPELVHQAYVFAAQNPGVLKYVPCYCGCENDGHRSNVDCFVESRASNGAVTSWDNHGMT